MATASQRSGGALLSLARFGFIDLEGTIAKLDELVSLVGDVGRSALAALSKAASPDEALNNLCLLYTSPSPRDGLLSRMPSSA